MYSRYRLAQKYLHYYLTAANGRGHGIHSPFVFDLVVKVLNDGVRYADYAAIEELRRVLKKDATLLEIVDMGAGSAWKAPRKRSVGEITRHAAKPAKLGQLLYRVARYYRPRTVLELGTSLGFSTAYLAAGVREGWRDGGSVADGSARGGSVANGSARGGSVANGDARGGSVVDGDARGASVAKDDRGDVAHGEGKVWSIEGSPAIAEKAGKNLQLLGLEARLVTGNFDRTLPEVLKEIGVVDLAFVDGNHRRDPTLAYFELLMQHAGRSSVLIFDDIHWSEEMEEAWAAIRSDPRVYLTIDLFFIGLVFLREEFKVKQDFVIRF